MANSRIPDDKTPQVFERAARLYAQNSQTYSEAQLIQAGVEAQIPAECIQKALQEIQVLGNTHEMRNEVRHKHDRSENEWVADIASNGAATCNCV